VTIGRIWRITQGRDNPRFLVSSDPAVTTSCGFGHHLFTFDTSSVIPLRSSSCLSPDPINPRPFPSAFTTMAFDHSRRRWFGTCSCKPIPRGRPSSVKQLRTQTACLVVFVLVAHNCRYPAQVTLGQNWVLLFEYRILLKSSAGRCGGLQLPLTYGDQTSNRRWRAGSLPD
jgi:hypothetical protein